jgi:hypothetical protein
MTNDPRPHNALAIFGLCLMIGATAANANEHQELLRKYDLIQKKMTDCADAVDDAARHGNVWQSDRLTVAECKATAMESFAIGQRLLGESMEDDDE